MGSRRETPRASQNPETQLKTLNRGILSTVASTFSEGAELSAGESSRATPRFAKGSLSARSGGGQGVPPMSRAEHEAAQRRKEYTAKHGNLLRLREEDEKQIQERRAKSIQLREARFEARLDELTRADALRVEASSIIRDFDIDKERRKVELYNSWDGEVSKRVEHQLSKFMSPAVEETYGFRHELRVSDHPGMRDLRDQQSEQRFHRYAQVILKPSPRGQVKDQNQQRKLAADLEANRTTSRPTLPVEQWDQQHHYCSPNGYFAQGCERGDGLGEFHSQRRMGTNAHMIDESDGVVAHGKTKNRFEKHLVCMLVGTVAKEGESARHKQPHGAGSGAPCQDHFYYEQGIPIVDAEFPVGRKMYHHLHS